MRDEHGRWRCPRCRPATEPDWAALVDAVQGVDPIADSQVVLTAARQAAPRPAQQRALVTAVAGDRALLHGGGAAAPVAAVFRLIDLLIDAGVAGVVRPTCPGCGRVVALVKWVDGVRICQRCDRHVRAAPCAALLQLAVDLPAAVLARCLGIDISSAVAWQRAAAGDWHQYAARAAGTVNPP